jgi:salicylate hydroxylase
MAYLDTASDGIKSAVRSSIVGDSLNSVPSGHSAYRMLIPASKINSDPELAALKITDPNLTIIYGNGRRII